MYTLLIVDDEDLIRSAVSTIIDWKSLGFSTIYEADNGRAALEICRTCKIDLVLTDIVMPFMDGLALSEALKTEFPELHVVILSGHEDFEYAKQSVDLGVMNYILKPVGASSLYLKMKEICKKLHLEKSEKQYISKMKSQLHQSIPIMQEKFLYVLVCTEYGKRSDIHEKIKSLELPLTSSQYIIGIVETDMSFVDNTDVELYLFITKNIVMDVIGHGHCLFDDNNNHVIIVFNVEEINEDAQRIMYDTLQVIQMSVSDILKVNITCAEGSLVQDLGDLNRSYNEALTALDCRYSLGYNRVYYINDLDFIEKSFFYPFDGIKDLINSVKFLTQQDIEICMRKICADLLTSKSLSSPNIKMVFIEIISNLLKELSNSKQVSDNVWNMGFSLFNQLESMKSVDEVSKNLLAFSIRVSQELHKLQSDSCQLIIQRAKEYIENNYMDESVSLSTAAENVVVSTGYLSVLFKKETGINFVDYLTNTRMEHAKKLLKNTEMKSYEIAYAIGYSNPHYFSISFKKYSGMTPSEYKNSGRPGGRI